MQPWAVIVHTGAGRKPEKKREEVERAARDAVAAALAAMREGGNALDMCVAAVRVLEDSPVLNAGTGSVLTVDGRCEMDAALMVGSTQRVGAVANVERIRHPIELARAVMERTDHVLLSGEGAERFARHLGFPEYNPVTEERRKQWKELLARLERGEPPRWARKLPEFLQAYPELLHGTVGCVTLGPDGEIVAGTSTGGIFLKLFGRIGDTPIPGAGTYATSAGGASATGIGEGIMRSLLTFRAVQRMEEGLPAQEAARRALEEATRRIPELEAGLITVDRAGRVGFAHNTEAMPVAYATHEQDTVQFLERAS